MPQTIIFVIGGPGSGKGTQCAKMVQKYGFTHLSTGDILRAVVASGSETGIRINKIMKSGQLVSNEEVLNLLKDAINKSSNSKGFLIDGYPRELQQGVDFERMVYPCSLIIYFDADEGVMVKRLLKRSMTSGRVDDNETTIKKRLKTFSDHVQPILEHFKEKVITIKADRSIDEIFTEICKSIDPIVS